MTNPDYALEMRALRQQQKDTLGAEWLIQFQVRAEGGKTNRRAIFPLLGTNAHGQSML